MKKHSVSMSAAALAVAYVTMAGTGPAQAASCTYMAHNQFGQYINGTHAKAHAIRKGTACRRARRRCNRRLRRAMRQHKLDVSSHGAKCHRITNL